MAISFIAVSTAGASSGLSATLSVPTGTANGDVLLVFAAVDGGSSNEATTSTTWYPTGFTKIRYDTDDGGVTVGGAVFTHVASSEPASYTWPPTGSFGSDVQLVCLTYRGVDTTTPVDVPAGQPYTTQNTSIIAPSVTTGFANDLVVCGFFSDGGGSAAPSITLNASLTSRKASTASPSNFIALAVGDILKATAGAVGNITSTASGTSFWVGQQIGLKAAAGSSDPFPLLYVYDEPWNLRTNAVYRR